MHCVLIRARQHVRYTARASHQGARESSRGEGPGGKRERPMAETVQITARGKQAKIRNPWAVGGLSLITLGIYYLFWYFYVNREMSDWGEEHKTDIGLSPGTSLVAITI